MTTNTPIQVQAGDSFLFDTIFKIQESNLYLLSIVSFLLIILSLVFYTLVSSKFSFQVRSVVLIATIPTINYIVAFIYPYNIEGIFMGLFFLIISFILMSIENKKSTIEPFFHVGLLYGLTFLISYESILLLPSMLLSVIIFGKNGIKDFLSFLFGAIVCFYILITWLILVDKTSKLNELMNFILLIRYQLLSNRELMPFVIAFLSLVAAYSYQSGINIHTRKYFMFLFFAIGSIFLFNIFFSIYSVKSFVAIMGLSSFYFSSYLIQSKNQKIKNGLILIGIALASMSTFLL